MWAPGRPDEQGPGHNPHLRNSDQHGDGAWRRQGRPRLGGKAQTVPVAFWQLQLSSICHPLLFPAPPSPSPPLLLHVLLLLLLRLLRILFNLFRLLLHHHILPLLIDNKNSNMPTRLPYPLCTLLEVERIRALEPNRLAILDALSPLGTIGNGEPPKLPMNLNPSDQCSAHMPAMKCIAYTLLKPFDLGGYLGLV